MIQVTAANHANNSFTIKDAVAQAVTDALGPVPDGGYQTNVPTIMLGAGIYAVSPGDFNPITAFPGTWSLYNLSIVGEGYGAVQLVMNDDTGVPLFGNVDLAARVVIQNIDFLGTTGQEVCLRFAAYYGRVWDYRIIDCTFNNFATAIDIAGTNVTSEFKMERAQFYTGVGQVGISINNPQSVDHWYEDISVFGSGVWLKVLQGGVITIRGLECTLFGGSLIEIGPPNAGMGQNNDGVFISGFKTDPLEGGALLVNNRGTMTVSFRDSNFNPAGTRGNYFGAVIFDPSCLGLNDESAPDYSSIVTALPVAVPSAMPFYTFVESVTVTLSAIDSATIIYTLDGSSPIGNPQALYYTQPLVFTASTRLTAVAIYAGVASGLAVFRYVQRL